MCVCVTIFSLWSQCNSSVFIQSFVAWRCWSWGHQCPAG